MPWAIVQGLVVNASPHSPVFNSSPVYARYQVNKLSVGQTFLLEFQYPSLSFILLYCPLVATLAEISLQLLLQAIFTWIPGMSLTDVPISGCGQLTSNLLLSAWNNSVDGI